MICLPCCNAADSRTAHDGCDGTTRCDCQHLGAPTFRHANGQSCYGCQICLVDEDDE